MKKQKTVPSLGTETGQSPPLEPGTYGLAKKYNFPSTSKFLRELEEALYRYRNYRTIFPKATTKELQSFFDLLVERTKQLRGVLNQFGPTPRAAVTRILPALADFDRRVSDLDEQLEHLERVGQKVINGGITGTDSHGRPKDTSLKRLIFDLMTLWCRPCKYPPAKPGAL